jgi:hypothetical protein
LRQIVEDEPVALAEHESTPKPATAPVAGRAKELAVLSGALTHAIAGQGGSRLVAGEAGIGKSRLISEVSSLAVARGAKVLSGSCADAEGAPAYLPYVEALDLAAGDVGAEVLGADAPILGRILPALSAHASTDQADRYAFFRAMHRLVERLAKPHGALLIIEDLHWADEPSLRLLEYLASHITASKVLVLASYRHDEVASQQPLAAALANMRRSPSHDVITLGPLNDSASRAMIRGLADLNDGCQQLVAARTAGHPLYIVETLKHLQALGPVTLETVHDLGVAKGVSEVIGRRVSQLSEACRRMLSDLSAFAAGAPWELLAALFDGDEEEILDRVDEALAAQIIRERETASVPTYEFSHALIRASLYRELNAARRARRHRRIAQVIERLNRHNLDAHLVELAHHYCEAIGAGCLKEAVNYSERAGLQAMERWANEEAHRQFERALAALEASDAPLREQRAKLHELNGIALHSLTRWGEAHAEYEKALGVTASDESAQRTRLLIRMANSCFFNVDLVTMRDRTAKALTLAEGLEDPELIAAAKGTAARVRNSDGDISSPRADLDEVLRLLRIERSTLVAPASCGHVMALYWAGRFADAEELAGEAISLARAGHDGSAVMLMMPAMGLSIASKGRYRDAERVLVEAERFGKDHDAAMLRARAASCRVGPKLDLFDLDGAERIAEEAAELAREYAFVGATVSTQIDLLTIAIRRGDVAAAEELEPRVAKAVIQAKGFHGWIWRMRFALARAELALARDEWRAALTAAQETVTQAAERGRAKYEALGLLAHAHAHRGLGHCGEATTSLRSARAIANRLDYPALVLRVTSQMLGHDGDDELAAEARSAVTRISSELDDPAAKRGFESAPAVTRIRCASS